VIRCRETAGASGRCFSGAGTITDKFFAAYAQEMYKLATQRPQCYEANAIVAHQTVVAASTLATLSRGPCQDRGPCRRQDGDPRERRATELLGLPRARQLLPTGRVSRCQVDKR
jgi:hypothetical protein